MSEFTTEPWECGMCSKQNPANTPQCIVCGENAPPASNNAGPGQPAAGGFNPPSANAGFGGSPFDAPSGGSPFDAPGQQPGSAVGASPFDNPPQVQAQQFPPQNIQQPMDDQREWQCGSCGQMNEFGTTQCAVCGANAPGAQVQAPVIQPPQMQAPVIQPPQMQQPVIQPPVMQQQFQDDGQKEWCCGVCNSMNEFGTQLCIVCGANAPGAQVQAPVQAPVFQPPQQIQAPLNHGRPSGMGQPSQPPPQVIQPPQPMQMQKTYTCPYSQKSGLTQDQLIASVATFGNKPGICPICASEPWGDPNYVCPDLLTHLETRHKFNMQNYTTQMSEEDQIKAAIAASMNQ